MSHQVFVYCDDPSHAPRRVAVTNFILCSGVLGTRWAERAASRAPVGGDGREVGSGRSIVRDAPAVPGWANDPEVGNREHRNRYELTCRKCSRGEARRTVAAREETLFAALDGWRALGVSEVSLTALAASLQRKKPSGD